jgi:hypothetical protein
MFYVHTIYQLLSCYLNRRLRISSGLGLSVIAEGAVKAKRKLTS